MHIDRSLAHVTGFVFVNCGLNCGLSCISVVFIMARQNRHVGRLSDKPTAPIGIQEAAFAKLKHQ